jgi:DNA-binding NtrC family response regulator
MTQAQILVVDDEPDIRELVREILEDEDYRVTTAENGQAARAAFTQHAPDLVLLDIWMPDIDGITLLKEWSSAGGLPCPVVVMSGHGSLETAVEATRLGAFDFVQKPISLARLLSIVESALESRADEPRSRQRQEDPATEPTGSSAVMQLLRSKAEQAASQDLPVLITGEAGSGRENLARFIHRRSGRRGPFVVLDSIELHSGGALDYLLGSENGDRSRPGVLEGASDGTLFIPDLEELSEDCCKTINQVLEAGQVTRQGGEHPVTLNVRLISSADDSLLEAAGRKESLQRLYYQLNVLPLTMPALRERPEDVPELVRFYAEWFPNNEGMTYRPFSVAAQNRLRNHDWPGNIRELKNMVRQLLVLGGDGEVSAAEVDEALRQRPGTPSGTENRCPKYFDLPLREAREQFEREYLIYKLREAGGSVGRLADAVGMERTHLYRKLRALGVDPKTAARQGAKA